jgi:hypothetical protein
VQGVCVVAVCTAHVFAWQADTFQRRLCTRGLYIMMICLSSAHQSMQQVCIAVGEASYACMAADGVVFKRFRRSALCRHAVITAIMICAVS